MFNLSDLLFHLLGITPLKVRRSKRETESPLVRLSFRDVMRYCYLSQTEMDSSFFRLEAPVVQTKSRDVMRFVLGYFTERLNDLEMSLEDTTEERYGKLNAAKQIRDFLRQHGLGTVEEITQNADEARRELDTAFREQQQLRGSHRSDTHFVDQLREQLRALSADVERETETLADLADRISQQDALKAELMSAKIKLARATSASAVLAGVAFQSCPSCGSGIAHDLHGESACKLCGQAPSATAEEPAPQVEAIGRDLTSRIEELQDSLLRHRSAHRRQERTLIALCERKSVLDRQLTQELSAYDSAFLARFRQVERRVATLQERLQSLQQMVRLPESVGILEREADELAAQVERIKRQIDAEKGSLTNSQQYISAIEEAYLKALLAVNLPGVTSWDNVTLNPKTWLASIAPGGNVDLSWDYYNAGSGGKKTLLKVCFALALHQVAEENGLPLPSFLIIDSPMKNISTDVNRDKFIGFYRHLFELARGPLAQTQFIIIDNEYPQVPADDLEITERYMTPSDDEHPPLISYYRGP